MRSAVTADAAKSGYAGPLSLRHYVRNVLRTVRANDLMLDTVVLE
jgi:hypothetical protein